ncbi:DUF4134 family protein [Dyadobacter alkalitolerans]|uniref:DUF4134 family protein n=1 Tax=Dyadobacter alkalitolerans TaxID=492736 RepID=UPI0003F5175A|nr:DUF4134 family protein [Dyadobacter alkalitolerans]
MKRLRLLLAMFGLTAFSNAVYAQASGIEKGAAALDALTGDLEQYLDPVTTVVYMAAAIVGVIGAFRVYTNWQQGKDNVMSGAMGWFGAMLFLLIANAVVRAMFIG